MPQFHVLIERRDSRGQATPATVVKLDRELITGISDTQSLCLYRQSGRLEARPPELPVLLTIRAPQANEQIGRQTTTSQVNSREGTIEAVEAVEAVETAEPRGPQSLPLPCVPCGPCDGADRADRTEGHSSPSTKSNAQAMDSLPDWVQQAAHNITLKIGIARPEAEQLAYQAYRNGRDASYIMDNLDHVTTSPKVKSPATLFTFLVRHNQQRYSPSSKKGKPTTA